MNECIRVHTKRKNMFTKKKLKTYLKIWSKSSTKVEL